MTVNTVSSLNELSYLGVRSSNPPNQVVASRAPLSTVGGDYQFPVGTLWVDQLAGASYQLVSVVGTTGTWDAIGGGAVQIATINNQAPIGGNYTLAGTANQITATNTAGTTTFSLPAAVTAPGSLTTTTTLSATTTVTGGTGVVATTGNVVATAGQVNAGTSMTATAGNITATNGNFVLGTAGNKLVSTSVATTTVAGANSFGSVTLVGGTATVATTAVTANSLIVLWRQSLGATGANPVGLLTVGAITPATQFVIHAATTASATTDVATDVSVVGWMIIN